MIPGVGIPGVPADFERRSVPESQWRGHYAELYGFTVEAVRNAWEANFWGTRDTHDGNATQAELDFVVVNEPRRGRFYERFYHEAQVGGTKENPLVLPLERQASDRLYKGFRTNVERGGGAWQLGLFSYPNEVWGWTHWIENKLPLEHPVNHGLGEDDNDDDEGDDDDIIIEPPPPPPTCIPDAFHLCLADRFRVSVEWLGGDETHQGRAVPLTSTSGYFWFFRDDNVEITCKVVDGTTVNDHWWFFYAAMTNVGFALRVEDVVTGEVRTYKNAQGTMASHGDTAAFEQEGGR